MFKIKNKKISSLHDPYIIAEMSGNHNGSLARALKIVDAAAEAGVDAIKLQTYTADSLTLNSRKSAFKIRSKKSLWYGEYLYDLYSTGSTPWEWHKVIFQRAKEHNLDCFSSPFDLSAIELLEDLNTPAYKIASAEITDVNLIKSIAVTGKPIIMSTGMASINEIEEAVNTLVKNNCDNYALLKCTSNYPCAPKDSNLETMNLLRDLFNCEVGFSDHTLGIGASIAAVARGASIIEKHFTLKRTDGGIDSKFSMEPNEMSMLVLESRAARESIGTTFIGPTKDEIPSLNFRRSLFVCKDIKKGEIFNHSNVRSVRPSKGLHPRNLENILGKCAIRNIQAGTPMSWDFVKT